MMLRFSRSRLVVPAALALLEGALVLSGCSNTNRIPQCPGAAILADVATRPVLKAGVAGDPSAVLYTVQITNIDTSCVLDARAGETLSDVNLTFRATRAPSGQAAHYVVPYFLAINQGERIINKRMFNVVVDFAPGASSVVVQTSVNETRLKLENGHLPTDYQFLAGQPLSQAEQAYVKTMSPYAP